MSDNNYNSTDSFSTASSTDTFTNKTFDANGTGNSLSNVDVADLSNGTDGELITWDATGAPATVSTGTSGQILTSNGAGAAPTFQTSASAGAITAVGVGIASRTGAAGAGTQNIAHGLGKAAKTVIFRGFGSGVDGSPGSQGSWDGTNDVCIYWDSTTNASDTVAIRVGGAGANYLTATVTATDATNFTLTWVENGTAADVTFTWQAFG